MKKYILGIITGLFISVIIATAASLYSASDVEYTTPSGEEINVQAAIDNLYYQYNSISSLKLNIKSITSEDNLPTTAKDNDIVIIPYTDYNDRYLISRIQPTDPTNGMIWINFNHNNPITYNIEESKLPLGIAYQYHNNEWLAVKAYIYHEEWNIFSSGYDNWKVLSTLIGKDYHQYANLNAFMNEKENSELMFSVQDATTYLINSSNLIQDMKKTDKYSANFTPYALSYNKLTNVQKHSYGLPFYALNGSTEFGVGTTAGCDLTPGTSATSYGTSGSWSIDWTGSTNCCGGRIIYTNSKFDYSKYIKINYVVTRFASTYSSQSLAIGFQSSTYKTNGITTRNTGTTSWDISTITGTYNVAVRSHTCSNENNTTTGSTIRATVTQIYFE